MVHAMDAIMFPRSVWRDVALPAVVALAVVAGGVATLRAARTVGVSQKNRMFQPGVLSLERGDLAEILNDDAPLLHHAYVATPEFSFDSGEQLPGNHTEVRFTVPGTFTVRCAIHPKMHLYVTVQ